MPGEQLYPLSINPGTGEPFLRLPTPNDNIIVTPPRMSDVKSLAPIINHERVSIWLEGPPIPYNDKHAEEWLGLIVKQSEGILTELRAEEERNPYGEFKVVGGCPVRHIREVLPDGTDVYLGDIAIVRASMEHVLDAEERKRAVAANEGKAVGDGTIEWEFRYYLKPTHHGRGIMSAAVLNVLYKWAALRMGVRWMVGYTFAGNGGSRRVLEKSDFVFRGTLDGKCVRGVSKTLNYLVWDHDVVMNSEP